MTTKRSLAVAILCTCLTMVLVSATLVKSAEVYNPWMDVNHDGRINVLDLIKVANVIGTSGDPALNVTLPSTSDQNVWWLQSVPNAPSQRV